MKFGWESDDERLKRYMKISPLKKLKWLEEMRKFMLSTTPKHKRKLRFELREMR